MSSAERSNWRDEALSHRHRMWGIDCPAVDLDFVLLEFDLGLPAAIIDYKHYRVTSFNRNHPSFRALRVLADNSGIPFFVCRYWPDLWAFEVHPINDEALKYFPAVETVTEAEFVKHLYRLRGRIAASFIEEELNGQLPIESIPF